MKVLLSLYACLPDAGSEDGSGWNALMQYARSGFEVWGITRTKNREGIEAKLQEMGLSNVRFHYVELSSRIVNFCDSNEMGMYLHYFWWQQKVGREAKKLDARENFDFSHHVTYGSLQQGTGLWRLRKKMIYGPVGGGQFTPNVFRKYFYKDWFKHEILRRWISEMLTWHPNVRRALRQASLVYVVNNETHALAQRLGSANVQYFHDLVLPAEFCPDTYPARPVHKTLQLLWVGRMFSRKGLPLVLEALGRVSPEVDFHLTIVGDGPLADQVPQWTEANNLAGKVTCTGRLPWMQVREMYRTSDVFMFCSLRESGGMQYVEAMAWGLPVITLDMHGGRVIVPDGAGVKVAVENRTLETIINDLACAVEKMYRERDNLHIMGQAAHQFARQHNEASRQRLHQKNLRQMLGVDLSGNTVKRDANTGSPHLPHHTVTETVYSRRAKPRLIPRGS